VSGFPRLWKPDAIHPHLPKVQGMETNSTNQSPRRVEQLAWLRRLVTFLVASTIAVLSCFLVAQPAAADAHVKDRYGHSVRVPNKVVVKLIAKHNVKLVAVAAWLPRSKLKKWQGTRKEFNITLVKVQCETFPLVGRTCWRTNHKVILRSIVDYRVNRQGLQQGLITAYCDGMDRCPSWVNRPRVGGGGGAGGGGGGGW
jgi:hypothetical protein